MRKYEIVFIIHTMIAELFLIANAMNNFGWIHIGG